MEDLSCIELNNLENKDATFENYALIIIFKFESFKQIRLIDVKFVKILSKHKKYTFCIWLLIASIKYMLF